ncbi:hypothetical protein JSY36_19075 [Bacillus sp. H-16]|uniref:hypothetical protein n=1 Tax=Alteribacter salitolerans TaxID=2912333 RepID=UPI00196446F9|nr:hypothetical protein [Alteribacter salitolerans]MBM7097843.1 hypothetical protein [Alteribacter salitolerans]
MMQTISRQNRGIVFASFVQTVVRPLALGPGTKLDVLSLKTWTVPASSRTGVHMKADSYIESRFQMYQRPGVIMDRQQVAQDVTI